jgi:hypothetical protein
MTGKTLVITNSYLLLVRENPYYWCSAALIRCGRPNRKEELMSPSYALPDYVDPDRHSDQHERAAHARSRMARALSAVSTGSTLLLAAFVSALLVGANQLVESWTDGNLLSAWVVLWLLAFAALALLAGPSRRAAASLGVAMMARRARRVKAQQDEHFWESALSDPRLMAEIRRAMGTSAPAVNDAARANWRRLIYIPSL